MSILKAFSRVFPPPRFMTLPNVGVDISDASLKYVQFRGAGHRLTLESWGDMPIVAETVARGTVVNKDALVSVLKDLRRRLHTEFVRVSLPEERAYLFETTLDRGVEASAIRSMIEFHLEENVPLAPREALFDYTVVGRDAVTGGARVSVAVYARDTITGYYESYREAGFYPLSFEVEAQAVARAIIPSGHTGTHMIVDFGHTRTGIGIVHNGVLMFTSTIEIGGVHISDAMRRSLGAIDEKEITRIKNEQGLLRSSEGGDEVVKAIVASIASLKDELNIRINYWNLRSEGSKGRTIDKVILCGGSANLAGLTEYLTEELEVSTERAAVWQNAFLFSEEIPPIGRAHSYGYATAIGLALTDFLKNHD
ncbi:pilus assembly protein PilM [Patescibacteria group bacterium]|nr:pilus assembly protein PilM [Patescibacteria group bacterium]